MALNPADPHFLPFAAELLPLAVEKQMAIIAMKVPARGRLFREGGITSMSDALSYVLTHPVSTAIIGCDNIGEVEKNVTIATNFAPLTEKEMARLENLTASYATEAAYFKKGAS
jgi:aryl-alcohol dehydrogenase-like predicted oxidoreductase